MRFLARGREEGNAGRKAVGPKSTGDRDAAQVQQIDEIGVVAEVGVEVDRICLDLGDGVDRARGRQEQEVHFFPLSVRRAGAGPASS